MNKFTIKSTALACCILSATVFFAQSQGLTAVNDTLRTGPSQTVRKNIIHNDLIPGDTYLWELKTFPATAQGTVNVQGDYLSFTPATGFYGKIDLKYELRGSGDSDEALVTVIVSEYNSPANVIDPDVECYSYMPENVVFGSGLKYHTQHAALLDWIDAMSSPLVGDLNGDGKPEIVVMGLDGDTGSDALNAKGRYINIYNGQNGNRICRVDITSLQPAYGIMDLTSTITYVFYHRAPTSLALADLDNDGLGEIVMCHTETGRVAALKPTLNSAGAITGLVNMWEGKDQTGKIVSFKAPLTGQTVATFGMPHPYIADLNGDGIPEVIVYNKIYNGKTGRLLMAWQGAAAKSNPVTSSYTAAGGLSDQNSTTPLNTADAGNIRAKAMTGRRTRSESYSDQPIAVPAIVDIDGDGQQEVITGNRIHKFKFNSLTDHTQNTYYTIEGPQSATVSEAGGKATYNLSDGFTRVSDIDGDGTLDIVVETFGNASGAIYNYNKIVVFVWDILTPGSVKACVSFMSKGAYNAGGSIPFIGDINGKLDGYDGGNWTRKLPEICILGGGMYIDRVNTFGNRTGVAIHPRSSVLASKFNQTPSGGSGHILGLTWDASATAVEERLKVSWGMEHDDKSTATGITLFDFDNNNTADLCYRDEKTLRVISPARSGKDYVPISENTNSSNPSVMLDNAVFCGTGYEYPVIADVNMDGSADIVVTNTGTISSSITRGWVSVFEYKGQKWAPCPPVWNQSMYDPRQIREDLKVNARPVSMLTEFEKHGETIHPYNGSWIQTPIVRAGDDFVAVVRKPDAMLTNMTVAVVSSTVTKVTLTIRNNGSASIGASTPIAFYNAGTTGKDISDNTTVLIGNTQPVGVDIFPDETVTKEYSLSGNLYNCLIWVQIMDNGSKTIPAGGYDDCEIANNTLSGIDCPYLIYTATVAPDSVLCGTVDNALLTATPANPPQYSTQTYQWYRNDILIAGATSQTYTATLSGQYKCFVTDGVCRAFSSTKTITHEIPAAVDDYVTAFKIIAAQINVLANDTKSQYCNVLPVIASDGAPKHGTASAQPDGTIRYTPDPLGTETEDSIRYILADSKATVHITLIPVPAVTLIEPKQTDTTICAGTIFDFKGSYVDNGTFGNSLYYRWEHNVSGDLNNQADWIVAGTQQGPVTSPAASMSFHIDSATGADTGYYRLAVADLANINNPPYRALSPTVHLHVTTPVTVGTVSGNQTVCSGETPAQLTSEPPSGGAGTYGYQWQQSADNGNTWVNVSGGTGGTTQNYTPPALTLTTSYRLTVVSACKAGYSNTVTVVVGEACAVTDNVTASCETVPVMIDVLQNDILAAACAAPEVKINVPPKNGTATVNGNKIEYRSKLSGLDSLTYIIACGTFVSVPAKVYITVASEFAFADDVWHFGTNSQAIRFTNSAGIYSATDASGESKAASHENSLVVSSPYCDGQLVFYASHNQLYNSLHETMSKGTYMGHQSVADGLAACYAGNNKYLFFSVTNANPPDAYSRGLKAYTVDMNADHGRGAIVDSTEIEADNPGMSESIELLASDTLHKYWLVYAYHAGAHHELRVRAIDARRSDPVSATVAHTANTSTVSPYTCTLKASPQQNRIAIANSGDKTVDVFDFNPTTGQLTERRTTPATIEGNAYGTEFSPDGNQIYATGYSTDGLDPVLCQYSITPNDLTQVICIKYWTQTGSALKGGGLKLGPDGKIYILTACESHLGTVSNPNATTPLSNPDRYSANGMNLGVPVDDCALQFSAGLTRPSEIECNTNTAPVTQADKTTLCLSHESRTVKVNVIANDLYDADGDTVYLSGATFVNIADTAMAYITVNPADSTISLTVKPDAYTGVEGHTFDIDYYLKDNGLPASSCATGKLEVKTYPTPSYPDIRIRICPDIGNVNLSKYLDTINDMKTNSIQWTSPIQGIPIISPAGTVSTSSLSSAHIHTFTCTVGSLCVSEQTRKFYIEVLANDRIHLTRDTVAMCYQYAEAIQIDQLFGIEANGVFDRPSAIAPYIKQSAVYGGTSVNGKKIYEDNILPDYSYHGVNNTKKIELKYTANTGCLNGKEYTMVIILTPDIRK